MCNGAVEEERDNGNMAGDGAGGRTVWVMYWDMEFGKRAVGLEALRLG